MADEITTTPEAAVAEAPQETKAAPALRFTELRPGMTVAVDEKIKEVTPKGERERIQTFEGVIIARGGQGNTRTITVRKVASGVGVEKIFPLNMPAIDDIQIVKETKTRRAKLKFLRKPHARQMKEVKKPGAKK